jgi:molybdate transport system ATP-binding protein
MFFAKRCIASMLRNRPETRSGNIPLPTDNAPKNRFKLSTTLEARVHHHNDKTGITTLFLGAFELRVPRVAAEPGTGVAVDIDASDVSIALSRPMDVSITNRLPGTIVEVEYLDAPYARVTFDLGVCNLHSLVTWESVERLALEPGLKAWAMIKTIAITQMNVNPDSLPEPRPTLQSRTTNREMK